MTKFQKSLLILLLMGLFGLVYTTIKPSFAKSDMPDEGSAVGFTKLFYQRYMQALARNDFDQIKPDHLQQYLTPSLVELLTKSENSKGGLDEDYFIKAQDYLDDWVTHIQAREMKATQNSADISVTLGENEPQQLEVHLKAHNHRWCINSVKISRAK